MWFRVANCDGEDGTIPGAQIIYIKVVTWKISDFGAAVRYSGPDNGTLCERGTTEYRSPEIAEVRLYSPKPDVWSMGRILWKIRTLRDCFSDERSVLDCLKIYLESRRNGIINPPHLQFPLEPRARRWQTKIDAMLAVDPALRPEVEENDLIAAFQSLYHS